MLATVVQHAPEWAMVLLKLRDALTQYFAASTSPESVVIDSGHGFHVELKTANLDETLKRLKKYGLLPQPDAS
jgi:hypothetical protein